MIENNNDEILKDICWAFSYISDLGHNMVSLIIEYKLLPRLVQLLDYNNLAVSVSCLRTLGNVLTGNQEMT
jgi:hypothetical protein